MSKFFIIKIKGRNYYPIPAENEYDVGYMCVKGENSFKCRNWKKCNGQSTKEGETLIGHGESCNDRIDNFSAHIGYLIVNKKWPTSLPSWYTKLAPMDGNRRKIIEKSISVRFLPSTKLKQVDTKFSCLLFLDLSWRI